jgi:hypothetical protein
MNRYHQFENRARTQEAFYLVAAADFHEAPAGSGDLNRGGEDLDASFAWVPWEIPRGGRSGGIGDRSPVTWGLGRDHLWWWWTTWALVS